MQRRNVKCGVFLSLVTVIALMAKIKPFIQSNQANIRNLERFSKRKKKKIMMEERNRSSQELQESIAHTFTSVITSLDALPFLMKKHPEEAEKNINEISDLARKSLDDVRKAIHK